jgi:hypothetical protein
VAEPSRPAAKELSSWFFQHLREAWCLLKNSYLTFDRRTLGLTRILLGWFLICDLFRRAAAWPDMLSDVGVLPNWVILEKPQSNNFSLLHGFTTAPELWVLWVVILATYVALLVGYKTKLAQVLSLMFITSMNGRVLLIENGGYVVQSLVLLWTCFMPLGDRFSVDAMLASMRRRRERTAEDLNDRRDVIEGFRLTPFVSIVGIAVCLQIAAIYYFNVVHKFGPGWKRDFNATHYVMYVDRMITPIVAHVRDHIPFRVHQVMTAGVIASEAGIAFCMLLPQLVVFGFDVKLWLRRIAIVLINVLHIGFGSTFVLGPFAWALCVFATVLFSYEDWETTIPRDAARASPPQGRVRQGLRRDAVAVPCPGPPRPLRLARVRRGDDRRGTCLTHLGHPPGQRAAHHRPRRPRGDRGRAPGGSPRSPGCYAFLPSRCSRTLRSVGRRVARRASSGSATWTPRSSPTCGQDASCAGSGAWRASSRAR